MTAKEQIYNMNLKFLPAKDTAQETKLSWSHSGIRTLKADCAKSDETKATIVHQMRNANHEELNNGNAGKKSLSEKTLLMHGIGE